MSKTAQRKRDAYAKGYRAGRYGLWAEGSYRFPVAVISEFERGRKDGRRDRLAAMGVTIRRKSLVEKLLFWLKGLGA